jgi:hypothetical protein
MKLQNAVCQATYLAGSEARAKKIHKNNNPHAWATQLWAWWLAGWNDEDIAHAQKGR